MQIMDGKKVASVIKQKVWERVQEVKQNSDSTPGLAVILAGEDPASQVYVRNKNKTCVEMGFQSFSHYISEDIAEKDLLDLIENLNQDPGTHGILVQLPLPPQIDSQKIIDAINPEKDVDGFHPQNFGKLVSGNPYLAPCTPAGVMEILKHYDIPIEGKNAVILGRSNIVGKPMAHMLLKENATISICHSKTKNLKQFTQNADILVAAIGRANFVTADMVKEQSVIIDVGINRVDGKLKGDVAFDEVSPIVSHITPVPGGVGPMTIAMLMQNTLTAFEHANEAN